MSSPVDKLLEVIGNALPRAEAQAILDGTNGDIFSAVAAYFSSIEAGLSTQSLRTSHESKLRTIIGSELSDGQLRKLLRVSGNSIEDAVGAYFDNPDLWRVRVGAGDAGGSGSATPVPSAANTGADPAGPGVRQGSAILNPTDNVGDRPLPWRRQRLTARMSTSHLAGRTVLAGTATAYQRAEIGVADDVAAGGNPTSVVKEAAAAPGEADSSQPAQGNLDGPVRAAGGARVQALHPRVPRATTGEPGPPPVSGPPQPAQGAGIAAVRVQEEQQPQPAGAAIRAEAPTGAPSRAVPTVSTSEGAALALGATTASTANAGAVATQPQAPRLLDGNLIAYLKGTQGPYPVAPLLPLPQHRRPDGSLFLSHLDGVPGRTPPFQPLDTFQWPMLLGQLTVPLEFDTHSPVWSCCVVLAPEVQQQLLAMALKWHSEGKLKYGVRRSSHAFPKPAKGEKCGGLCWRVETLGPGRRQQPLPCGDRLALYVESIDFLRTAAKKLPDVAALKEALQRYDSSTLHPSVRLAATAIGGQLDRLVHLTRDRAADLNEHPGTGILTNIRILGPALDPLKGASLREDVEESDLVRGSGLGKAAADVEGAGSASDSDGNGYGGAAGGGAASDSAQENDAYVGSGGKRITGRKRARDGGGGRGQSRQGTLSKAKGKGGSKGGSKGAEAKQRGKGKSGGGKSGGDQRQEDGGGEESMGSPQLSKRARKVAGKAAKMAVPGGRIRDQAAAGDAGAAGASATGVSSAGGAARPVPPAPADGRFRVALEFYITAECLKTTSPPGNWEIGREQHVKCTKSRKAGGNPYDRAGAENLTNVVHVLLEYGSGLYVGPDCDGAINTMDVPAGGPDSGGARGAGPSTSTESDAVAATIRRSRAASRGVSANGARGASGFGAGGAGDVEEDDDVGVHDLDTLLDSIRPPSDLPEAVVPPAVVAHPKPFQLQGLEWMLRRERRGDAIGRSLLLLHPAWVQVVVGSSGLVLQVHRAAPHYVTADFLPAPVGGTCGGFLCDEMGLGKSLQTLMLIVSNPSPAGWAAKPVPLPSRGLGNGLGATAGAGGIRGGAGAAAGGLPPMTGLVDSGDKEPIAIPTTLLVTPANLQSQWVEEIQRHLKPGSVKWAIYQGRNASSSRAAADAAAGDGGAPAAAEDSSVSRRAARISRQLANTMSDAPNSSQLGKVLQPVIAHDGQGKMVPVHECDVVLVSYEVLRKELTQMGTKYHQSLPRLGFWRIVLDEAQLVANSNSVAAEVVSSLYRRHAWVVTGTPISSSLDEVQGLCEFLSYEPFYHGTIWRNLIQRPYSQGSPMGVAAFRALLRGVMLRRSKAAVEDQLALPPCSREELQVDLSGVERAFYEVLKGRFNAALAGLRSESAAGGAGPSTSELAWAGGSRRLPLEDGRRSAVAHCRATTALVELRQCCCHPHIVRREAQSAAAGSKGGGGAGANGTGRLSMRQIMAKMVSDAYSAYDQAVAAHYNFKLQLAALSDYRKGASDTSCGAGGSAAGGSAAGGSGYASGATAAAAGGRHPSLLALLEPIQKMTRLVSEPDLLSQAKVRGADGEVNWEGAKETMAYGNVSGGMASVAPHLAAEQARERKRRWLRLELDCLLLRCYTGCLLAPDGTLQLLAAQANARFLAEAHQEAVAKAERKAAEASHREAARLAAEASHEAARREAEEVGQQDGDADTAAAAAKPRNKRWEAGGGALPAGEEQGEQLTAAEASKKARDKLALATRVAADAAAKAAVAGAEAEALAREAAAVGIAAAVALSEAALDVVAAAEEIQKLNDEIKELRLKLGVEHVDFTLAETELRRSRRQQGEAAAEDAGGRSAGPSGGAAATAAADITDDSDSGDEWRQSDDSDDDGGRRRPSACKRKSELVGGLRSSAGPGKQKKKRISDGAKGGGTAGLLLTRGGTKYQEAIFRSEVAVRTFQSVTTRTRPGGGGHGADDARLLAAVRGKWHELQHLLNQQAELGLAADVAAPAAVDGGDAEAGGDDGSAVAAAVGARPSGSNPGAAAPALSPQQHSMQLQQQLMSQQAQQQAAGLPGTGLGRGAAKAGGSGDPKVEFVCPICLDVCERRTITKCAHTFCTDCIHEIVQNTGTAPCPICRRPLSHGDLFDSVPEEEAEQDMPMAPELGNVEYGTKVSALLMELSRMEEEEPGCKALVFSSWGRLLRLVQEALKANGIQCVSMTGGNPEARQAALQSFLHDPDCRVLLLLKSTSGGAAGLTLTVAHTAFIMEPAVNPGLEAQAAARICRLGQDRPTRVVRIIARHTVEERVLALQQHKQQLGDATAGAEHSTESVDGNVLLRFFDRL